jgi:hypothetical protein
MGNLYGDVGDFFNDKAAQLKSAANQAQALGLNEQANDMRVKSAFICELFAEYVDKIKTRDKIVKAMRK